MRRTLQAAILRKLGYHKRIYLCNMDLPTYNFCYFNFNFNLILFFGKQQDFTEHKRKRKLVNYNFGFPSQPELMGDSAAFIFVWSCEPVMTPFLRIFLQCFPSKIQNKYSVKKFLAFLQNFTSFSRKTIYEKNLRHILTQVLVFWQYFRQYSTF
jgi:hypothetical protein